MRFDVYRIPKCNSNKTAISLHPLTDTGFGSGKEHNAYNDKVIKYCIDNNTTLVVENSSLSDYFLPQFGLEN